LVVYKPEGWYNTPSCVSEWVNVRQNVKRFGGHWVCESTINAVHLPFEQPATRLASLREQSEQQKLFTYQNVI